MTVGVSVEISSRQTIVHDLLWMWAYNPIKELTLTPKFLGSTSVFALEPDLSPVFTYRLLFIYFNGSPSLIST